MTTKLQNDRHRMIGDIKMYMKVNQRMENVGLHEYIQQIERKELEFIEILNDNVHKTRIINKEKLQV